MKETSLSNLTKKLDTNARYSENALAGIIRRSKYHRIICPYKLTRYQFINPLTKSCRKLICHVYLLLRIATRRYHESIDSIFSEFVNRIPVTLRRFARKQTHMLRSILQMEAGKMHCPFCNGHGLITFRESYLHRNKVLRQILFDICKSPNSISRYRKDTAAIILALAVLLWSTQGMKHIELLNQLRVMYNANRDSLYFMKDVIRHLESLVNNPTTV